MSIYSYDNNRELTIVKERDVNYGHSVDSRNCLCTSCRAEVPRRYQPFSHCLRCAVRGLPDHLHCCSDREKAGSKNVKRK